MAKFERKSYISGVFFYKLIIHFRDLRSQKSIFFSEFLPIFENERTIVAFILTCSLSIFSEI